MDSYRYYCRAVQTLVEQSQKQGVDDETVADVLFHLDFHTEEVANNLLAALDCCRSYSFVDLALAYRTILPLYVLSSADSRSLDATHRAVDEGAVFLGPDVSNTLRVWINPGETLQHTELTKKVFELQDMLLQGSFAKTQELSCSLIKSYPLCFELYALNAQASACGGLQRSSPFAENTTGDRIIQAVHSCEAFDQQREDSLATLAKLSYCFGNSRFGHAIMSYWLSAQQYSAHTPRFKIASQSCLTPSISFSMSPKARAVFAEACESDEGLKADWLFQLSPISESGDASSRSTKYDSSFALLFAAIMFESTGQQTAAVEKYKELRSASDVASLNAHVSSALVRIAILQNKMAMVVDEISAAFVENESYIFGSLRHTLAEIRRDELEIGECQGSTSLRWAIVYWLAHRAGLTEKQIHNLHVASDEFLYSHGCSIASNFLEKVSLPTAELLVFLMYVCVPAVLKRNYKLKRTEDLNAERIAILQWRSACKTDPLRGSDRRVKWTHRIGLAKVLANLPVASRAGDAHGGRLRTDSASSPRRHEHSRDGSAVSSFTT
ncbi:hypothetical protein [Fuerstiella marisgermanici]|uniref:Uncharacterized protein n=1 Tax=Fuerstiella marisgermanici TaxID=1891926 RepID=A0A1P8WBX8_9PLAN|nr:hypothetical protein [Fuerstiella marisgermanici]APZ91565.1 hypothetical protein Fuma_01154 [Fuerstiella marisgermanici]